MRLTERKICYPSCDKKGNLTQVDYIEIKDKKLAEEKLCQLEDIEDELGIDLITILKVLKGEIYSLHPKTGKICLIILPIFYYCGQHWVIGCRSMELNDKENCCDSWDCYLKDYGKTWALTKEELL